VNAVMLMLWSSWTVKTTVISFRRTHTARDIALSVG
jgi:hypothetical protein